MATPAGADSRVMRRWRRINNVSGLFRMFTMEIISGFHSTEFDYAHTIGICDPRMDGRIDSGSVELLCESSVHGYGVMDIGGRLD